MLFLRGNNLLIPFNSEPLEHSVSNSRVTTRERGDIPGCVPAVDVLIELSPSETRDMVMSDPYWKVWDDYRFGVIGWSEWKNHLIHKRPPYSPFRNPSKSHFNRYD